MLTTSVRRRGGTFPIPVPVWTGIGCPTGHTTSASLPAGSGGFYRTKGQ